MRNADLLQPDEYDPENVDPFEDELDENTEPSDVYKA